jgi:hypothetical protein
MDVGATAAVGAEDTAVTRVRFLIITAVIALALGTSKALVRSSTA